MKVKTYKKSSAFWKHGKHKGALAHSIVVNKQNEAKKKPAPEMVKSIRELMVKKK